MNTEITKHIFVAFFPGIIFFQIYNIAFYNNNHIQSFFNKKRIFGKIFNNIINQPAN